MSSAHSRTARSLYRRILRELPSGSSTSPKQTTLSAPSPIQRRIRTFFAAPLDDTTSHMAKIQEAEQFIQYVQAQRMYATLIERYNPGMDMSEEERVRLTARRVGMNLPIEFEIPEKKT